MEDVRVRVRRRADPLSVQKIFDAIKHYNGFKNSPRMNQVAKICKQQYSMTEADIEKELQNMVDDGLLVRMDPNKGVSKGQDQQTYHIPTDFSELDSKKQCEITSHDWYCFTCHKPGPALDCSTCHRVYHPQCLDILRIPDPFVCPACRDLRHPNPFKASRRKLNKMLQYVCDKLLVTMPADIRVWNPEASAPLSAALTTDRCAVLQNKKQRQSSKTADADLWRYKLLIHPKNRIDLDVVNSRTDRMVYRKTQRFRLDVANIVHNVVIFHGEHSAMADAARQMHRECLREIEEIANCRNCFLRSHEQYDPDWFCHPCKPVHLLAYAKQKGYPFWPAKVIRIDGTSYDVRFFGADHERAIVDKICIRPITTNVQALGVKRTASWNKAYEELRRHQNLLDTFSSDDYSSDDSEPSFVFSDDESSVPGTTHEQLITKELRVSLERLSPLQIQNLLSPSRPSSPPSKKLKYENDAAEDVKEPALTCVERSLLEKEIKTLKELLQQKDDEIHQLKERCSLQLAFVKKKQWCYTCEEEATMHCCWNTSYCSVRCQRINWRDHKKHCKRGQMT